MQSRSTNRNYTTSSPISARNSTNMGRKNVNKAHVTPSQKIPDLSLNLPDEQKDEIVPMSPDKSCGLEIEHFLPVRAI